jgi:hypothetical protein
VTSVKAPLPPAAVIEILDTGRATSDDVPGSTIVPDAIRINGQPLLVEDGSVVVHEMNLGRSDIVRVSLTLYARRVIIAAEGDL